jgi:hypothetical protein
MPIGYQIHNPVAIVMQVVLMQRDIIGQSSNYARICVIQWEGPALLSEVIDVATLAWRIKRMIHDQVAVIKGGDVPRPSEEDS